MSWSQTYILLILCWMQFGCDTQNSADQDLHDKSCSATHVSALLASRIDSLALLKSEIDIQYFANGNPSEEGKLENDLVSLTFCMNGKYLQSNLAKEISQSDIKKAKDGSYIDKFELLIKSPYAVMHRNELAQIYVLARRRYDLFGINDVAFYDLAETAANKIIDPSAFVTKRDSGEKGYINSFNHITAQALITTLYSKEIADFIADVHERDNMPELIHGRFSESQLVDLNNNPVDNYIDMMNNEIGQSLGWMLKEKYGIERNTEWDTELLTAYLNDLQSFYQYAFEIKILPFHEDEVVVQRFLKKINARSKYTINS